MTVQAHHRPVLKAALLMALSAYFVRLLLTGDLANYVNTRIEWLVWIGATLLTVYGIALCMRPADPCCEQHHASWKPLAMLVPLALGLLLPSKPLGRSAIGDDDIQAMLRQSVDMSLLTTAGAADRDPNQLYSPSFGVIPERLFSTNDQRQFTILDWLRLYAETENKQIFEGQKIDVVGFVVKRPGREDGFVVTRFFMRHCAFDTIPIGLPVRWDGTADLREDEWVRVRGTLGIGAVGGEAALYIDAADVRRTDQPETPYLYPQLEE